MPSEAAPGEAGLSHAQESGRQQGDHESSPTVTGISVSSRRLAEVRKAVGYWRDQCRALVGLDDAERAELTTACVYSVLRAARIGRLMLAVFDAVLTAVYVGTGIAETVLAYVLLHPQIHTWSLVLYVWSGSGAGRLIAVLGFRGIVRVLIHLRLPEGLPPLAWSWVSLGLLGLAVVAIRAITALVEPSQFAVFELIAVVIGLLGVSAFPRLTPLITHWSLRVLDTFQRRAWPKDQLLGAFIFAAGRASTALAGTSTRTWRDPAVRRDVAGALETAARLVENAPRFFCGTRWWEFGVRAELAAPYRSVGSVIRSHRVKVLGAQTEAEWSAICASLSSGALAAARLDWAELTRAAPSSEPRLPVLRRALPRLTAPVTLIAGAILLPIIFHLDAYAVSLRSVLIVSAVLALLPGQSEAAAVIRDTMTKTQTWRR